MLRFIPVLALLLFTACGLAENEQDDKNKRIYITFADPAFERFCLGMFDLDHDGRISRYEAQRVLAMDCSGRNISAMWEIGEFSRLRELDCSGNNLTRLDLRKCPDLQKLDCGDNEITSLDIDGLRGLTQLDCAENLLARLDLKSNSSLRSLDCRGNLLVTLDLTPLLGAVAGRHARQSFPYDRLLPRFAGRRPQRADRGGRPLTAPPPASFSADCPRRFPSPARIASCRLLRCLLLPPPALSFAFRGGFPVRLFLIHC